MPIVITDTLPILYYDDSDTIDYPSTDSHDPFSKKYYSLIYRPKTRQVSTPYTKGVDIVVPSTPNGCVYECISSGISSSTLVDFLTDEGRTTTDGTVLWKCKPDLSRLRPGDTITTSTWTGDTGVTLDNPSIISSFITIVRVTAIPANVKEFTITNTITITRADSSVEERIKRVVIPIKNQ